MLRNIFIPNNSNLLLIRIGDPFPHEDENNYADNIIVEADNECEMDKLYDMMNLFRERVIEHYVNSQSFGWIPNETDRVYWVTIEDQSAIGTLKIKHSTKAVNQFRYLGNCYQTETEAKELLSKLKPLVEPFLFRSITR